MADGDDQGAAEASEHQAFVLLMSRFMDPFEEADHEAEDGDQYGDSQVEDGDW